MFVCAYVRACLTQEHDGGVPQEAEGHAEPPLHPSTVRLHSMVGHLQTQNIVKPRHVHVYTYMTL